MGYRNPGTRRNGTQFSELEKESIWRKGAIVAGYDQNVFRKDACGAWMRKDRYGDTSSKFGWEIDHKQPVSRGGSDDLWNLQPLQWENNRRKSDGPLACAVKGESERNVAAGWGYA